MVLEKKIFKWHHPIFAFSWLSPLWRGPSPSFEQTWSPFTQGWFVPSLVKFGPEVLEKKSKMSKVNRQTDDGQKAIRKAHLSLRLRWANKISFDPDKYFKMIPYYLYLHFWSIIIAELCWQHVPYISHCWHTLRFIQNDENTKQSSMKWRADLIIRTLKSKYINKDIYISSKVYDWKFFCKKQIITLPYV